MSVSITLARYREARLRAFCASREMAWQHKLLFSLGMCLLTALSAQVRFHLPSTPVPVTGQVFVVLLSGVILGHGYGALSQGLYAGLGALGVGWFASASALRFGPTGGYIIGFVAAAALIGWITDKHAGARRMLPQLAVMIAGVCVIYVFGAVQFSLVMRTGLWDTLSKAVVPFVAVDLGKAALAAGISSTILPKRA